MTNYMLSTNYKNRGKKRIRLPFISCTSLRALIPSSFTFRSKVFSLPLGNQNSPLAFAKMPSVMGQLPALCISGPSSLRAQWTSKGVWGCPGQAVAIRCPRPSRQDLCSSQGQHSMVLGCSLGEGWTKIRGFQGKDHSSQGSGWNSCSSVKPILSSV